MARLVDRARALPRRGDEGRGALGLALEEARQRRESRLLAGSARRENRDEEREGATAPGGHACSLCFDNHRRPFVLIVSLQARALWKLHWNF